MRKKWLLVLIVGVMMTMLLAACGGQEQPVSPPQAEQNGEADQEEPEEELIELTVAELRSEFWLPAYLADTLGYYEDEGLVIEFVTTRDGPQAFQGMHAGSADFTMLSTEPVFRAQDQGLESIIIMSTLTQKPYMFVGAPEITDVEQLKGKNVFAGMPGSAPYSFALAIFEKAGIEEGDVYWADMQYGASLGALEQGHVDAIYLSSINKDEVEAIGANILVDVSDPEQHEALYGTARYESSIITATKEFVDNNPDTIQKFANAVVRAMIWMHQNSDEDVAEMAGALFEAGSITASRISYLRPVLSEDGIVTPEGHETIVDFCLKEGIIDSPIPYDEVYNMSFIQNAYEKYKE